MNKGSKIMREDKKRVARLEIVARMYKRGYTFRDIRDEVIRELGLESYSLGTVHKDTKILLEEWQKYRIEKVDQAIQLELERIDGSITELWDQWDRSKGTHVKVSNKKRGIPVPSDNDTGDNPALGVTMEESTKTEEMLLGDVAYISEIRAQEVERRKLLGLYAATKSEITGKDGAPLNSPTLNIVVRDNNFPLSSAEEEVEDV